MGWILGENKFFSGPEGRSVVSSAWDDYLPLQGVVIVSEAWRNTPSGPRIVREALKVVP